MMFCWASSLSPTNWMDRERNAAGVVIQNKHRSRITRLWKRTKESRALGHSLESSLCLELSTYPEHGCIIYIIVVIAIRVAGSSPACNECRPQTHCRRHQNGKCIARPTDTHTIAEMHRTRFARKHIHTHTLWPRWNSAGHILFISIKCGHVFGSMLFSVQFLAARPTIDALKWVHGGRRYHPSHVPCSINDLANFLPYRRRRYHHQRVYSRSLWPHSRIQRTIQQQQQQQQSKSIDFYRWETCERTCNIHHYHIIIELFILLSSSRGHWLIPASSSSSFCLERFSIRFGLHLFV